LAPNLETFYHDSQKAQDLAAWLGFWATLAGAFGGVGFGLIAERALKGKMRTMLIVLTVLSTLSYLWFALVCGGYLTKDKEDVSIMLYVSCIFGGLVLNGTIPLFYESAVEVSSSSSRSCAPLHALCCAALSA
jgi:FLVCR family MFS transporter